MIIKNVTTLSPKIIIIIIIIIIFPNFGDFFFLKNQRNLQQQIIYSCYNSRFLFWL
jgi:hypothetical protein